MKRIIQVGNIRISKKNFSNPQTGRIYSADGIAPTLNTCQGGGREPKVIVLNNKQLKRKRIGSEDKRVIENKAEVNGYRIRKLTPKECWRLMGFSDEHFESAKNALNEKMYKGKDRSSSQLYKQAGNSIVTDVLYYIFKELYIAMPYLFDDLKVGSYFSGIGAFEIALDRLFENDISHR